MNQVIKQQIESAQEKQKTHYDKFKKDLCSTYVKHETVKLANHIIKEGHSKAFTEKFIGLCKIVHQLNDLISLKINYIIKKKKKTKLYAEADLI